MSLEGPSFYSFIRFVLSAVASSITIGLVLYRRRLLLHEVIGPDIMICLSGRNKRDSENNKQDLAKRIGGLIMSQPIRFMGT
jgi:hypothetical protein